MPKITLNPAPTFKAKALIPVPGDQAAELDFVFKHRGRLAFDELKAGNSNEDYQKLSAEDKLGADVNFILKLAESWSLEAEFNFENVRTLLDNYPAAANAISSAYGEAIILGRLGN
jgi:hypothetical protein